MDKGACEKGGMVRKKGHFDFLKEKNQFLCFVVILFQVGECG